MKCNDTKSEITAVCKHAAIFFEEKKILHCTKNEAQRRNTKEYRGGGRRNGGEDLKATCVWA